MVRNGNELDFCWKECVESLLGACDVVAVSVAKGEDSTEEEVREWVSHEPRLSINMYDWPFPKGNPNWFVEWIQYARMHTPSDWVLQLDADEVLHENSYDEVRKFVEGPMNRTAIVTRWNFWRDHRHTIPQGYCCGKHVIRIAPKSVWMPSDGFHPDGNEAASMSRLTGIEIHHYGFIRKHEAFFKKERALQNMFFNSYDPRLEASEQDGRDWSKREGVTGWEDKLDHYGGTHPAIMKDWLKERGFNDT